LPTFSFQRYHANYQQTLQLPAYDDDVKVQHLSTCMCSLLPCWCAGLELGGLLGGTLSGVLSDSTIKAAKSKPQVGLVGRRVQICMAYTVACIGVLLALKGVPAGKHATTLRLISTPSQSRAIQHLMHRCLVIV